MIQIRDTNTRVISPKQMHQTTPRKRQKTFRNPQTKDSSFLIFSWMQRFSMAKRPLLSIKGIWRRPNTSSPDKAGNTVLVAHRFTYNGPAVFYHLDLMKKGHRFAVFWDGKEYDYEVIETKIVEPTAIEIENNTKEPIMTLYTCTPMWTAKQRLVIVSKLISETPIQ